MIRLAILFGGRSIEHEVSLISAYSVLNAIDRTKYEIIKIGITREGQWLLFDGPDEMIPTGEWLDYAQLRLLGSPEEYNLQVLSTKGSLKDIADVVFPIIHGPGGEDGSIQGLLETIGIPCVGCSLLGSALAMNRVAAREALSQAGIPVCRWLKFEREELEDDLGKVIAKSESMFEYPVFVKPSRGGSSMGVSRVGSREELKAALHKAAEYDRKIIIEEYIDCREIEVGIIGNYVPLASAAGEVMYPEDFLDHESRIERRAEITRTVPANIPAEVAQKAKAYAIASFKALKLQGFARVDYLLDKNTGAMYVNEINTIPPFEDESMFPKMWASVGLGYSELLDRIIGFALDD